jgi:hypothetical protein
VVRAAPRMLWCVRHPKPLRLEVRSWDDFRPRRRRVNMRDTGEIERTVAAFARSANGGLILTPSP